MIKKKYKEDYHSYCDFTDSATKYTWCAREIFGLSTYDSELDEIFVKEILDVCKVILTKTNFQYIQKQEQYIQYIRVCHLLDNMGWIEWGTSIRGAWIDTHSNIDIIPGVPLTEENLKVLIVFMED